MKSDQPTHKMERKFILEGSVMRRFSCSLTCVLVVGLVLTSAYSISAQEDTSPERSRGQRQRWQRGEGGRRQFDPAQMIERQTQRAVEQLALSSEEAAVLEPRIKAIVQNWIQRRQEMQPLMQALRTAIDGGGEAQIKSALEALKAKQKEHKAKSDALQKDLVELLTLPQEAQLTVAGIVNSDGGFGGGFGGSGGRFGGGGGGRRGDGQRGSR